MDMSVSGPNGGGEKNIKALTFHHATPGLLLAMKYLLVPKVLNFKRILQKSLGVGGVLMASLLTKTPLPNIPPKNQTSSERWSLLSITLPPGKNNRMLAKKPNKARGMRVLPRHLAQPPVHMVGESSRGRRCKAPHCLLHRVSSELSSQSVPVIVPSSIWISELRTKSACELCPWNGSCFSNVAEP